MSELRRRLMIQEEKQSQLPNLIFRFPLIDNGKDIISGLEPTKINGDVEFSNLGAKFTANTQQYITYNLNSANLKYNGNSPLNSMRIDFILSGGSSYTGYMYITHFLEIYIYERKEARIANVPGSIFFSYTQRNLALSNTADRYSNFVVKYNELYRLFVNRISGGDEIYINGNYITKLNTNLDGSDGRAGYMTIGNNWRGLYGNGTRAFNGYLKDLCLFNRTFSREESIILSTL